jgi:hypothetical protein
MASCPYPGDVNDQKWALVTLDDLPIFMGSITSPTGCS